MRLKEYKDVKDETFVKVYHNNKQIYAGLNSMNPLKNLKWEYFPDAKYFKCVHANKKFVLLVI